MKIIEIRQIKDGKTKIIWTSKKKQVITSKTKSRKMTKPIWYS